MKLDDIASEQNLREWMRDWIHVCEGRLKLEWIEPNIYGSTVGGPDVKVTYEHTMIGLELKYLTTSRKGIKWAVRPAQRRYHHMLARRGGRSALLAYVGGAQEFILVRGDDIPLRDYASSPSSGCKEGVVKTWPLNYFSVDTDKSSMFNLEDLLFNNEDFWQRDTWIKPLKVKVTDDFGYSK
jgi:hypothetical protein